MQTTRIPKLTRHKATGQAVVRLNGKDHYVGPYGSSTARAAYEGLIADWLTHGRTLPKDDDVLTVNDLILAYIRHAERHYKVESAADGELRCVKDALRMLKELFGRTPAGDFGPKRLKAVRQRMIEKGWCRNYINHQINRIKRVIKWATSEELVSPEIFHGLQSVTGLRRGMAAVRESEPVRPVALALVNASLPFLPRPIRAIVELQLLTGMRPGEACQMRAVDLDMTGRVWTYRPGSDRGTHGDHKTAHHGHERLIYLGPRAQAVVAPWLRTDPQAYLFSPCEAEQTRNADRRRNRQSPMTPSQAKRRPKTDRKRPHGEHYGRRSYRCAVVRACERAFPLTGELGRRPLESGRLESVKEWRARLSAEQKEQIRAWRRNHRWHPHQLRHSAATNFRKDFGVELARIILGHKTAFTTEIYAEADRGRAVEVMASIG